MNNLFKKKNASFALIFGLEIDEAEHVVDTVLFFSILWYVFA